MYFSICIHSFQNSSNWTFKIGTDYCIQFMSHQNLVFKKNKRIAPLVTDEKEGMIILHNHF